MNRKSPSITIVVFFFLFGILPFVYLPITQDPELSLRYLLFAVFMTGVTFYLTIRAHLFKGINLKSPVVIAFGGYTAFSALSLTKTINTGDGIYEFTKIALCFTSLLLLISFFRNNKTSASSLPVFITFSAMLFSVFGMIQLIPMLKESFETGKEFSIGNSISSTLSNKNFFAETLLVSLPFSIYSFISYNKMIKWMAGITILISFILIVIIQSASVYFALLITLICLIIILMLFRKTFRSSKLSVLYQPKVIVIILVAFIAIPVSMVLLFPEKIDYEQLSRKWKAVNTYIRDPDSIFETSNNNNNSVYDRLFLAKNSIEMARENLFLGNGLANWKILYPKYGLYGNSFMSIGRLRFEHPHNDYLFILCESGLPGLCFWLLFLYLILYAIVKNIKISNDTQLKVLLLFSMTSIISFMIISLFGYPKERFFTMMILLCTASLAETSGSEKELIKKNYPGIISKIILCMLVIISWIQFQRYRSEVYLHKAFVFQKNSNFHQMQKMLKKAENTFHTLDMTATPLSWHLGQSYYYQGDHQRAFEQYQIASKENPFHMQVWNDLGALYEDQKNHAMALECFNKVFAMNPDFPDAKMNMVALYYNTGEVEKAYEILKNHIYKFSPKWRENMKIILLSKAETYVRSTQDSALANLLNKRLNNNPNYFLSVFSEAERDSISFEKRLSQIIH